MKNISDKSSQEIYKTTVRLHNQAEKWLKEAIAIDNDVPNSVAIKRHKLKKTYKYLLRAIEVIRDHVHLEPARSQVFLNAIKVALVLEDYEKAIDLVADGLNGDISPIQKQKFKELRQKILKIKD